MELTFNHVKKNRNKMDELLEKTETETHQSIKAKNWAYVSDTIAQDRCIEIMTRDMT